MNQQFEQDTNTKVCTFQVLEESAYPIEFLNMMVTTGFKALEDYLASIHASKAALTLLEDLNILTTWIKDQQGDMTSYVANTILQDAVASEARNIAKLGGEFLTPYGPTPRREYDFPEQVK